MDVILKFIFPPIHKEGYPFVIAFAIVTSILSIISGFLGTIGAILTIWCLFFFRDPKRVCPEGENFVLSPADGLVQKITEAYPPEELNMEKKKLKRVSIFLNVFDVHVNRNPVCGKVKALFYHPGKFFNASLDKASVHNERQSVLVETPQGVQVAYVQIAGLIARRIVCDLEEQAEVKSGDRFGIIRFGSRVDIYLPMELGLMVEVGQRVIGGETIIADFDRADVAIKYSQK